MFWRWHNSCNWVIKQMSITLNMPEINSIVTQITFVFRSITFRRNCFTRTVTRNWCQNRRWTSSNTDMESWVLTTRFWHIVANSFSQNSLTVKSKKKKKINKNLECSSNKQGSTPEFLTTSPAWTSEFPLISAFVQCPLCLFSSNAFKICN